MSFRQSLDLSLLKRAQQGDTRAFEMLFHAFVRPVQRLALKICGDQIMAEDITQHVFISVFKNLPKLRELEALGGWIKRITINETVTQIRRQKEQHVSYDDEQLTSDAEGLFETDWLQHCHDLEALLKQLPAKARAVLLLHQVEGYNHSEIAEMFNQSESFSKVTLYRAIQQLKKQVNE